MQDNEKRNTVESNQNSNYTTQGDHTMLNEEKKEAFKSSLTSAIREKCTELTSKNGRISYNDGKGIVEFVNLVFLKRTETVPKQVKAACDLALFMIAPSVSEKRKLIKDIIAAALGPAGLMAIIAGIGQVLGWGIGPIMAIWQWFVGVSLLGPMGLIAGGVSLAVVAGYLHFSSSDATEAEKFERSLIGGLEGAIDSIWNRYGTRLDESIAYAFSE